MTHTVRETEKSAMTGIVLHAAAGYDLFLWLFTLGRERAFREKMLGFAHLQPGESVLDVGCGTGTLAILAKRQGGPAGEVCGIDASPEMLDRARKKAKRAGVEVSFQNAFAQSLPYADARFDVVLSTVMLHHLPKPARAALAAEVRRVLKPGGRVLAIDFGGAAPARKSLLDHVHRRHGRIDFSEMIALFRDAGLSDVESGVVGMRDLQFVAAKAPCCV
jgi:ubiquinone/menaquinone biosynthesis C-methylase UbiE